MLYDISRMVEYLESELNSNKSNKSIIDEFPVDIRHANRIFKAFTGYTIYTYIQNRRMYLLGLRILDNRNNEKMYSLAKEYGYNLSTFVKAFVRFHGCTPSELKNDPDHLRTFLPLVITVTVSGGEVITPEITTIAPISLYVCNRHAKYDDVILQTRGIIESLRNDFTNNDTDFFSIMITTSFPKMSTTKQTHLSTSWELKKSGHFQELKYFTKPSQAIFGQSSKGHRMSKLFQNL